MNVPPHAQHKYNVTVSGETATLAGPDDIVTMYIELRRIYPPALSLEVKSIDEDLRLHHADTVNKVNSHHVHN